MFSETSTLKEVKAYLRGHAHKGIECPACKQRVQIYKRNIYGRMALSLIALYKLTKNNPDKDYFHILEFVVNNIASDFAKLRYWGLIVEKEKDDRETGKRTSGYWAITEKGKSYVLGKIAVKKYAIVYDSDCLGFSEELSTIKDALGKKFDYEDLMDGFLPVVKEQAKLL